jgi:hypothetical protein
MVDMQTTGAPRRKSKDLKNRGVTENIHGLRVTNKIRKTIDHLICTSRVLQSNPKPRWKVFSQSENTKIKKLLMTTFDNCYFNFSDFSIKQK